ncbi:MAG: nicotinamide mononucleotide transporter PnuC [Verrucomicrobia bacterium]|nr:nicotinamide mononucleotide transporter PnuC [Verrucomicrobiota bacterium]
MDILNFLQWPAMVVSVVAAWLVAAQSKRRRSWGFWWFLASNVLWVVWGWQAHAWALIALQVALATLNFRGLAKNELKK